MVVVTGTKKRRVFPALRYREDTSSQKIQKSLRDKFVCVATSLESLRLSTADSNTLSVSRCRWWNDCSVASVFADEAKRMEENTIGRGKKQKFLVLRESHCTPSWSYFPLNQVSQQKGLILQSIMFHNVFFTMSQGSSFYYAESRGVSCTRKHKAN
jgi:hypothetical protein